MNNTKDLIDKAINHYGGICLPVLNALPEQSGLVPIVKTLQDAAIIKFDSCKRVSRPDSIVDFIVEKGSQTLLVGVWPNGYRLTKQQQEKIEIAGRSYIAILGEWIDRGNIRQALSEGFIDSEKTELGMVKLQTSYWVYHARHGWYYDTEENKVRG
jgi:hypothetical protein